MATKKVKSAKVAPKLEAAPKPSKYEGKKLIAAVKLEECGRQEGSSRYKSLAIITAVNGRGIAFADYVGKGGVARFVPWFEKRKQITIKA